MFNGGGNFCGQRQTRTGRYPSFGVFELIFRVYDHGAAHALGRAWIRIEPIGRRRAAVGRDDAGVGARGRPHRHGVRRRLCVRLGRPRRLGRDRRRGRRGGGGGLRRRGPGFRPGRDRLGRRRGRRRLDRWGARGRLGRSGRRGGRRGRGRALAHSPAVPASAAPALPDADTAPGPHPAAETDAAEADAHSVGTETETDAHPAATGTEARAPAPRAGTDSAAEDRGPAPGTRADAPGEAETRADPQPPGVPRELPGVPPAAWRTTGCTRAPRRWSSCSSSPPPPYSPSPHSVRADRTRAGPPTPPLTGGNRCRNGLFSPSPCWPPVSSWSS